MTDATEDPGKPLLTVGKIAFILGVFSIVRLASEFVQLLMFGITQVEGLYLLIVALDVPVALLWLETGRRLRKRSPALVLLVLAASVALADALVSAVTLGPPMVKRLMDSPPGLRTGVFGARLVLYAAELVVSPIVLAVAFRWQDSNRSKLWRVFAVAMAGTLLLQGIVKWALVPHR